MDEADVSTIWLEGHVRAFSEYFHYTNAQYIGLIRNFPNRLRRHTKAFSSSYQKFRRWL